MPVVQKASDTNEVISLPLPRESGGMPLFRALRERKSSREFATTELRSDDLSNLLWAAFGISRPDGHRTAPSARNCQEIDIYVALRCGLYLFDQHLHALRQIHTRDIRTATGQEDYVGTAPVNLVYVADLARMEASDRATLLLGHRCRLHQPERLFVLRFGGLRDSGAWTCRSQSACLANAVAFATARHCCPIRRISEVMNADTLALLRCWTRVSLT
jgi:hypothetical protein